MGDSSDGGMLPNHSRSPANCAGEREALDDCRAAGPKSPRAGVERGARGVDVADERDPRSHPARAPPPERAAPVEAPAGGVQTGLGPAKPRGLEQVDGRKAPPERDL